MTVVVIANAIEDGLLKLWEDGDFLNGYFEGKRLYPQGPVGIELWDEGVPDGVAEAVLRAAVPAFGERGPRDLLTALRAGAKAYERHGSVAAPSVLWQLWKLGQSGSASLKEACAGSIRLFRLSHFWYGWVETGSPPALDTWAARERELRERTV